MSKESRRQQRAGTTPKPAAADSATKAPQQPHPHDGRPTRLAQPLRDRLAPDGASGRATPVGRRAVLRRALPDRHRRRRRRRGRRPDRRVRVRLRLRGRLHLYHRLEPAAHPQSGAGRVQRPRLHPARDGSPPRAVRHGRHLPVLRPGVRLALQPGRRRPDPAARLRARTTTSSRRAGSTTWSTGRSWCCTRVPATAPRPRASSSSRRSTTRSRTAPSATSSEGRPRDRSSPASTRWRPTTAPSSGAASCRSTTLDTNAILEFYAAWGERTNPEQQCTPTPSPSASPQRQPVRVGQPDRQPDTRRIPQRQPDRQPQLSDRDAGAGQDGARTGPDAA